MREENMSPNQWADFWYYHTGVNVIPATNTHNNPDLCKKPFWTDSGSKQYWISWKKDGYQNEPIPEELFKEWKANNAFDKGIAIICGQVFRGEHKRLWLNAVDCDNKAGTEAMCPQGVEETAKKTLVEQHTNPDKCHILFLTREPLKNRTINPNSDKQIEVKSMGKNLLYCSGGYHKDGSLIDIVGTWEIQIVNDHQALEKRLDEELGTIIKPKTTSAKVTDKELSKLNEGDNRQGVILNRLGIYFAAVPQDAITEEDCINKSISLNSKLGTPYDEARVVTIGKDFYKYRMNDEESEPPKKKKSKRDQEVKVTIERLDEEPQKLNAITLDKSNNTFILVYLPTKRIDEESGEITYPYYGHFVTNGIDGKRCIRITDKSLRQHYAVAKLFTEFEPLASRWKNRDINAYLTSDTKVNVKELFENLLKFERKYFEYRYDSDYHYQVCWIIHTYFYPLFDYTPYNDLVGSKGTGKSKAIRFLETLCYNGFISGNASASTIFRTVQGTGATLLLDEAEDLKGGKDDQLDKENMLRNGNYKHGIVTRAGNKNVNFLPESFSVYSPKALGHINSVDEVLADRCLPTETTPSTNLNILKAHPDRDLEIIYKEREKMYRLWLDYAVEVKDLIPKAQSVIEDTGIWGREMDLWLPLVTIALFLQEHGVEKVLDKIIAKIKIVSQSKESANIEDNLEFKILEILDKYSLPSKYSRDVYDHINEKLKDLYNLSEPLQDKEIRTALNRLNFQQGRRVSAGVPWINITSENIQDQKVRKGLVKPTQNTLGDIDFSHKKDDNVANVGGVAQ
jgi:hypothetical protein